MKTIIRAVLIDLSGTLHVDDAPTIGAIEALVRLRQSNVAIRFVTNTTKESGLTLYNRLTNIGFQLEQHEIYSSLSAAVNYVKTSKLKPFYLLSEDARSDFPPDAVLSDEQDAVVVGLAPTEFYYDNINKAFNLLLKKHPLIAIHEGKYYKQEDGFAIGPGCFTRGLEYAASTKAIVVGKPNKYFFESAVPPGIRPDECVMIGDDSFADIKGAMDIGMKGILVQTGKYRPEEIINPPPTIVLKDFATAIDWLTQSNFTI